MTHVYTSSLDFTGHSGQWASWRDQGVARSPICSVGQRASENASRDSLCLSTGFWHRVVERLARSLPNKANRVQSPVGSPDFRMWESCWMIPVVGGFSRGSPVSSALQFLRCSILTSITLFGSQDLAVTSRPNLFTHSTGFQEGRTRDHYGNTARLGRRNDEALSVRVNAACIAQSIASMEQHQNERAGETGDPRENPPVSGIIRPGIEPGSPWWEVSRLTAQPQWPHLIRRSAVQCAFRLPGASWILLSDGAAAWEERLTTAASPECDISSLLLDRIHQVSRRLIHGGAREYHDATPERQPH
ncbi:hypothetical protein PR048_004742 [Dryococelus australis]|uniref:Uncharacterized protein n=1 Tax=Dryococelus australis TaxID=614101 RepID=A0ABQ9I6N3_9NEOP|nr:hypothetical protein PR048_004742 [Dryococelus australis]